MAKGLIAAGVEAGDRVALLSRTRYEWTLLDYAIWFAGAVTVPVYETSSAEQVAWILADSGAQRRDRRDAATTVARVATETAGEAAALRHVWAIDEGAVAALTRAGSSRRRRRAGGRGGRGSRPTSPATIDLHLRAPPADPRAACSPTATSCTSSAPRSRRSTSCSRRGRLDAAVPARWPTCSPGSSRSAPCARRRPAGHSAGHPAPGRRPRVASGRRFLLAVPRVFEKVFNTASQQAAADGRGRRVRPGRRRPRSPTAGPSTPAGPAGCCAPGTPSSTGSSTPGCAPRSAAAAAYAVSGGAPLGERLGHFYRGIGITVLEGYGLTETTAAVTVNVPDAVKIGTVGRPLGGTTVRVADDGELQVRGGQVMSRLLAATPTRRGEAGRRRLAAHRRPRRDRRRGLRPRHRPQEGDPGHRRRQERRPAPASRTGSAPTRWSASAWWSGTAARSSPPWSPSTPRPSPRGPRPTARPTEAAGLVDDPDLRAEVQAAVDEANRAVSQAEAIRRFAMLPVDWTEEGGQLTPSLKLRRARRDAASSAPRSTTSTSA